MGCRPVSSGCDHCVGLQLHNDWLRANGRPTTSSLQPPALQQPEISRVRTFAREDHVVVAPGSDLFDEAISDEQLDYIILTIARSEEHTSELQSLMRISYAVFCLKKKKQNIIVLYSYQ